MKKSFVFLFLMLFVFGMTITCAATSYQYEIVPLSPHLNAGHVNINNHAQISYSSNVGGILQGVILDNGVSTPLGPLYSQSYSNDINESGHVVGHAWGNNNDAYPFLWIDDEYSILDSLGGIQAAANAVNDNDQVVGSSIIKGAWRSHAVLWEQKQVIDLGTLGGLSSGACDINNIGQVVGNSLNAQGDWHGFLWENGMMTDLGNVESTNAINDIGQIVGRDSNKAFLWEDGVLLDLNVGLGSVSEARSINNLGQIVGTSGSHAFLWENGMTADINDLVLNGSGWDIFEAHDINDNGQIVGVGRFNNFFVEAVLLNPVSNPVPEPSTILLMGIGLLGLVGIKSRKKKS